MLLRPYYLSTCTNYSCTTLLYFYRLNVFGYLSLNSSSVPGNNGLRDAITLLQWVRRNARAFGGDPDNVTLAGQSCGSVAAHLVSLSKASVGLFKRYCLTGVIYLIQPVAYYKCSPGCYCEIPDVFRLMGVQYSCIAMPL